jgi:hypothetical protein
MMICIVNPSIFLNTTQRGEKVPVSSSNNDTTLEMTDAVMTTFSEYFLRL